MLMIPLLILALLSCELWELAALFAAVLVHELGHIVALRLCGVRLRRVHLGMTGAVIDCSALTTAADEIAVAAAGSIAGLLWALLLSCVSLPHGCYAGEVSAVLSLFNLLPVPLLDGGRIFLALGGSERALRLCGLFCLLALLALCLRLRFWYSIPALLLLSAECLPPL